ncbi:MAG: mechanosensitive ion channel [Thiobacillus sp.]|nr:mechanosensitive ion channel [Thiobacillus sp.]
MLLTHPKIDTESTLIISFNAFSDSSLDIFIYALAKTTEWAPYHLVKQDVMLKIADIIAAHGAEIACPTRSLHIESFPAPLPDSAADVTRLCHRTTRSVVNAPFHRVLFMPTGYFAKRPGKVIHLQKFRWLPKFSISM